ncbi:MAG TPA: MFS transporter [Terriglobales bacterium]|nr:MFS transporter [Terriglobales bacterium]
MAEQSISLSSYLKLLRGNANFRRLWMAQIISEVGDWFYMVALYSMLLEFTGRAELLGIAFVLQVTPQALTSPFAGVINDRLRRQRVMIFSDLARAVIVSCMLLVRSPQIIWLVYPLLVLETVMWGLFEPARNAVVPNIVGSEEIIVANTLSSTTWSLNFFLGSALGGAVAAFLGRDTVFVLNGLSFVGSAFLISRMRFNEPHTESLAPLRWRDLINYSPMIEGVRYVRQQARLATAVFVKAGLGVTGASWIIFPILGKYIFPVTGHGIDPERGAVLGMSLLMGARGLGALIGPLALAPWAQQKPQRLRLGIMAGFLLYGSGYIALKFIQHAHLAYMVVTISHMGGAMVWVFSTTLLQLMTADKFRGRVFAAELGFCTIVLGVTAYLAGLFIDHGIDVRTVALATGVLTILAGVVWGWLGVRKSEHIGIDIET